MHIAIIAEYNPFHNGHAYQIDEIRRIFGSDATVSIILGGIFSQRGEPYIAPPYVRAEAAVACGADLALELPFPFSASPASVFAKAGVEIATAISADYLVFGSECGDTERLCELVQRLDGEELQAALAEKSDEAAEKGKTKVYSELLSKLYGEEAGCNMPNDILAIEYIRAIKRIGSAVKPFAILRLGDYKSGEGKYPSASLLRSLYKESGITAFRGRMPDAAYRIFEQAEREGLLFPDIEKLSGAVMLTLAKYETGLDVAFSASGTVGRLASAAKDAKSVAELLSNAATKRYTDAELSRAVIHSLLSVTRSDVDAPVCYTRLLAANERGRKVLASPLGIELLTKPSDCEKLSKSARAQYEKTFLAERAYALCLKGNYGHFRQTPRIIK